MDTKVPKIIVEGHFAERFDLLEVVQRFALDPQVTEVIMRYDRLVITSQIGTVEVAYPDDLGPDFCIIERTLTGVDPIQVTIYDMKKILELAYSRLPEQPVPVAEVLGHRIFICHGGGAHFHSTDEHAINDLLTEEEIARIEDDCFPALRTIDLGGYIDCPYEEDRE